MRRLLLFLPFLVLVGWCAALQVQNAELRRKVERNKAIAVASLDLIDGIAACGVAPTARQAAELRAGVVLGRAVVED